MIIDFIVSRNTDPVDSAAVTVAQFHAGTAFNVISPTATLKGTVRLAHTATSVADALGGRAEVLPWQDGSPALYNNAAAVQVVTSVVEASLPDVEAVEVRPAMGGEDFAFYAARVPAAFFYLGLRPPGCSTYPNLHQPDFDFADAALPIGIGMHVELARNFARLWKDGRA